MGGSGKKGDGSRKEVRMGGGRNGGDQDTPSKEGSH